MLSLKKAVTALGACALAGATVFALAGCGGNDGVAATWAHGEVLEESVTNYIENMRSLYGFASDESSYETFLKQRSYDPDAENELDSLVESQASSSDSSDTSESADTSSAASSESAESSESSSSAQSAADEKAEGTVQDFREYVIKQLARTDVVEWEAENRNLQVSDEELEEAVETNKQQVEAQYMSGTFESILQMQGYKDLDAYREELRKDLQVDKLETEVVGATESDEGWDQDKWDSFVNSLMDYADLHINEMPSGLPYDPATIAEQASASASSSETASTDDADAVSTDASDVTIETASSSSDGQGDGSVDDGADTSESSDTGAADLSAAIENGSGSSGSK